MRVAALYDIHGNLPALAAVLAELDEIAPDVVVIGGDVATGPQPVEVLEAVLGMDVPVEFVRGNCDRSPDDFEVELLSDPQLEVMRAWPLTVELDVDGLGSTLFCHATPTSDTDVITAITPGAVVAELLGNVDAATVVCGHTHSQYDRRVGGRRVVNAGSVGMPYEGVPGAAFWTLFGPDVEPRRTFYDRNDLERAFDGTGYPHRDHFAPHSAAEAAAAFEQRAERDPAA